MKENLMYSLQVMGFGMLKIFVVIIILTLIVFLLTKFTSDKKKSTQDED